LTFYKAHVNEVVRSTLERFEAALRGREAQAVFEAWERARRGLLAPERPFRALSYDALRILVPAATRDRFRLVLTRP
jgi:hypothetical protein